MGTPTEPTPAKYFVGLLSREPELLTAVEADLCEILGAIEARSEVLPWTASSYYEKEMGTGLLRRFVSFEPLISPGELAPAKLKTQMVEAKYCLAVEGRTARRLNADPGYVDTAKVVLASTKNAGHRIYLGSGIYAETTLLYYDGQFRSCHYTYPDFRWPSTHLFMDSVRNSYLSQLRRIG
jgi:hypothetical protein